ncbi:hypothetical protein FF124_09110 [Martelella lutilitoris]|uniref:Uncharacterized protein n=1 Tax=Martelella lutilitoris TaxID=2583532 RepID=A0A5C4JTA3_9HYPH|nr:hypothetical protein [Martelella lutilitoris]TNB48472.1 hypothetical protein FF124_09110 [Martelella lutilitoris]
MMHEEQFSPENFQYALESCNSFSYFDHSGRTVLALRLIMGKGAPVALYEGERALTIGARLYRNIGSFQTPKKGDFLDEFRIQTAGFELRKGAVVELPMMITLPENPDYEMMLEVSLVKELQFWLCDIGHPPLILPVARRHAIIVPDRDAPHHFDASIASSADIRAREARYEGIIFALLNQLSRNKQ